MSTARIIKNYTICFLVSFLLVGCVARINVQKATDDAEGIRYFLPQAFVKVTPRTDGGVTTEIVYLPDPNAEYAVQAQSILGNYLIDINLTEEGFLTLVNFDGDSTGVAKQLIESAANLKAAEIEAKATAAQTMKKEAKEEAEKDSAALKATEQAVRVAELNLEIAAGKLDLLEKLKPLGGAPDDIDAKIFSARLEVAEMRIRRDTALAALDLQVEATSAANAPDADADPIKAPEPVFFEIVMTGSTVVLRRAFAQSDRESWRLPKKKSELPDLVIRFASGSSRVVRPDSKTGALQFKLKSTNRSLIDVTDAVLMNRDTGEELQRSHKFTVSADSRTVTVDLRKDLPEGDYVVQGNFIVGPKGKEATFLRAKSITIER